MKEVIFFDIGHTLVTGAEASPRRLIGAALDLKERDIKRIGKLIMTENAETPDDLACLLSQELPHISPGKIFEAVRTVWEEQYTCVELLPGADKVIVRLLQMGYTLGIISNIWHPFFQGFSAKYPDIVSLFEYKVLSYRAGVKKPSPDIFLKAVKEANIDPSDCWMVGDTYELDIAPARTSGFRTVWYVIRPDRERDAIAGILRGELPGPDYAISDLMELVPFFENRL
ncbi:HAD family hydrolase [Thermodesulforhabdus norvegica]|uniref:Haloacid dehalogenase superfamily, subfamily IA, variant 3 with third motif having DD or ED/haloacid dehalogenase superfamily, subfamily IA, variant 1 with third motif having Dx(3-4)D or Dx(3-4)E n=1 Tax=Thermodesulforhabdus norvegica TaxID=39841 RepID=A0A1I4SMG1_9BACT|nr:HAD-IA family hydrolase [Thermodesulforhabdus norvegica]SFM65540.1 haloacid dehalogenase superfamily, subfamily IA, variant 3 with third motif having DD or ED/haloacid dehalogenase superfamily, subfamily IA, variant 1 with third motif having Dx(3-4)D or Dx(3-4)E [Thermodesulforhabdus norvegica]